MISSLFEATIAAQLKGKSLNTVSIQQKSHQAEKDGLQVYIYTWDLPTNYTADTGQASHSATQHPCQTHPRIAPLHLRCTLRSPSQMFGSLHREIEEDPVNKDECIMDIQTANPRGSAASSEIGKKKKRNFCK